MEIAERKATLDTQRLMGSVQVYSGLSSCQTFKYVGDYDTDFVILLVCRLHDFPLGLAFCSLQNCVVSKPDCTTSY